MVRTTKRSHLRRVMHHRSDIVRYSLVHCVAPPELTESIADVLVVYLDVFVAVRPLVLVPEAEGVAYLVHRHSELANDKSNGSVELSF